MSRVLRPEPRNCFEEGEGVEKFQVVIPTPPPEKIVVRRLVEQRFADCELEVAYRPDRERVNDEATGTDAEGRDEQDRAPVSEERERDPEAVTLDEILRPSAHPHHSPRRRFRVVPPGSLVLRLMIFREASCCLCP